MFLPHLSRTRRVPTPRSLFSRCVPRPLLKPSTVPLRSDRRVGVTLRNVHRPTPAPTEACASSHLHRAHFSNSSHQPFPFFGSSCRPKTSRLLSSVRPYAAPAPKVYNYSEIESKWQERWNTAAAVGTAPVVGSGATQPAAEGKEKKYILSMFPYPSGRLHMGHVRVYTISDTLARVSRMQGFDVLHPMGWDSFGLPAENAAIERNVSPAKWTVENIAHMQGQFRRLGMSFDWEKEVSTCTPEYYRWTQWLFLRMLENGLAYQKESTVNWDPIDNTVLANEQVDAEGRSWRSGAVVEQRYLKQWFLRTSRYSDDLLDGLDTLKEWPESVLTMQSQWIGRSSGATLSFPVRGEQQEFLKDHGSSEELHLFTTRPDTIVGVGFLAVAPQHPLVTAVIERGATSERVKKFVEESSKKRHSASEAADITGIDLGITAVNPLTNEEIPIYAANYVLMEYGSGAVMGVPAHDERDWRFAHEYNIPFRRVVLPTPVSGEEAKVSSSIDEPFIEHGVMAGSDVCGELAGLATEDAQQKVVNIAEAAGWGRSEKVFRLRDWLVSRQRYWGTPIPIVHCKTCNVVPVPDDQLPVQLPDGVELSGRGGSPLNRMEEWKNCKCPSYVSECRR
eukprot:TRINITY_DN6626_c0_g1_i1.p1 TRINITY_DN6626_c0_g1~~TRINITY_DN6626_c0_g1_i1.p1  ORF type:complete len:620 (-),score=115.92 TRINITY_DN6626_c0_g1_i1:66-1925(-)